MTNRIETMEFYCFHFLHLRCAKMRRTYKERP